nr:class I SAM-dependent methyltransferase [Actinomycetota bacterium]
MFDRIADLYDRARPGYPADVVEDLARTCAVTGSSRILEIGCGTGQLTGALANIGASILAVEPGAALAALARTNLAGYPAVEVRMTRFEDIDVSLGSFDLVAATTSFHWVDPALGYPKAADLLRPGGFLALVTNAHAAGGNHTEHAFGGAVRQLHHRLTPTIGDWTFPTADEIAERASAGGDMAAVWAWAR